MDMREIVRSERENTEIVQGIYAAFGRGDIPAILKVLSDDVEWYVTGPKEVSHAGVYRGKAQVQAWFAVVAQSLEMEAFEPQEFIAQHDKVAVMGFEKMRVKTTGRSVENRWMMMFQLHDGRIVKFFEFDDTAAVAAAFQA